VPHGGEVLESLRHLFAGRVLQILLMKPVADERLSGRAFALRDLILVMGEYQVDTAGVDVERLPEVLHAHCRTLDMPARTARAEGGLTEVLAGIARLPEGEVARVLIRILFSVVSRFRLDTDLIQMYCDVVL